MADFCSCQRSDLRGKPIASILNSQELKTVKNLTKRFLQKVKEKSKN